MERFSELKKMKLESITKGNFNLEQTKKTFKHENNLRFHFEKDGRFYEYAVDTINKKNNKYAMYC